MANTRFHDFRWVFLPYCIVKQPDGRYAFLNRDYKPVGMALPHHPEIKYEDHPVLVKVKGLTPLKARKLSWNGNGTVNEIYLYNDGSVPTQSTKNMSVYLEKLAILAKLKISY